MKFTLNNCAPSAPLTDEQIVARLTALDDMLDSAELIDSSAQTQFDIDEATESLRCLISAGMISDNQLKALIESEPGLQKFGSTENLAAFKKRLNARVAEEGFWDGFLGDYNTGLIGAVIAYARNNMPNLEEQVNICQNKLDQTGDWKIEGRSRQMFIRVRSKYLPAYEVYMQAVAALKKVCDMIAADPTSTNEKMLDCLKGTMYWDNEKMQKHGNQDTNWVYAIVRLLPSVVPFIGGVLQIAERFWFEPSQPVGDRGWDSRNAYQSGLNALSDLIGAVHKAMSAVRAKSDDTSREAAAMMRWLEKEVVYLGRGLTTAIRKVSSGAFVRFFSNRFIH